MQASDLLCDISCVINFYGRINLLEGILYSLSDQNFPKERFEVILVEDKGGTEEGKHAAVKFMKALNIKYFVLQENYGKMGYSRNIGLLHSKGKYILFLDDDTVILQQNFLSTLKDEFEKLKADAIIPFGSASYSLIKGKYNYHEPFFPTNRCMAYRGEVLRELGGFVSEIIGQEDVEFVIRFLSAGKLFYSTKSISYFHPPFVLNNINKAAAVGLSFAKIRKRYPFIIWFMLLLNGLRYIPLLSLPFTKKMQMQAKFSLGFLLGIVYSLRKKEIKYC